MKVESEIREKVQTDIGKTQRDYMLRQQLEAIRQELGEGEDAGGGDRAAARAHRRGADAGGGRRSRPCASSTAWRRCRRPPPSTA